MDEIVRQAMAKWPNVPHCYGWLALDARGYWRMRDERAQQLNLAGDRLSNPALVGFIVRNYLRDERGCWYFQNGPQRVYVNLEATPFIAHTDPTQGFVLHTGDPLGPVDAAWLTERGELILRSGHNVAQLDDRDTAEVLERLRFDGEPASDDALLAWLEAKHAGSGHLTLDIGERRLKVELLAHADVPRRLGFARLPAPA